MSALKAFEGGRLFGRRYGTLTPRVLALHGWGRSSADFDSVLDGLDAIALDLPGFGASSPPAEVSGAAGFAGLIRPVLAEFDGRPLIVGHSFGGRVALFLENRGLVLAGVPLLRVAPRRRSSTGYRILRRAHRFGLVSDSRMERIRRNRGSADYRAANGIMRDVLVKVIGETYERELETVGTPVRMVWGGDDTDVAPAIAVRALDLLTRSGADALLQIVEGAGHHLPLTHPQVLRSAIEELL